ncbi:MAG: diguanylate cyclase [Pseudomonadota bacterium]
MKEPFKVALISSLETANALEAALAHADARATFLLHAADSAADLKRLPGQPAWDLILSDLERPGYSALDLTGPDGDPHAPIVLIAGSGPDELAAQCLQAGLGPFLPLDDAHLARLPALLRAFIEHDRRESARCRAETRLRESEERYQDIFDSTSDLVQCVAPDGTFLYTNRTWRDTLGYTQDEIARLRLTDILHPDSMICCQDRFQRLMGGESLACIEFMFRAKSGETVHLHGDCGSIVRNGETIYTRGIFRNITDTVRAEAALRASEARYQRLYDIAPDVYALLNPLGEILSINRTGAQLLGYDVDELVGESAAKLIHPADQAGVFAYIERQFAAPTRDDGIEYRKLRKDGTVFWVHQRVTLEAGGPEPRMLVVCRDVNERVKLREQLSYQATHDTLTNLINRREFEQRLHRLLTGAVDKQEQHALCFLDLDRFKAINDSCGHIAGDELLRQIAALMDGQMRSRDTLARLGGDEFAILMEHCPVTKAVQLAEQIRASLEHFVFHWRDQRFSLGVSIGVVPVVAGQGVIDTLSRADAACYAAKRAGRNRIHAEALAA